MFRATFFAQLMQNFLTLSAAAVLKDRPHLLDVLLLAIIGFAKADNHISCNSDNTEYFFNINNINFDKSQGDITLGTIKNRK